METKQALVKREVEVATAADSIELSSLADLIRLSELLSRSGYFADVKEASQAFVKVLYGRELGFGAITSMTGVHIITNKPTLSANLISAAIKRSNKYDFQILKLENDGAVLEFFESGRALTPKSSFLKADAEAAGLLTGRNAHTWRAYPRNMYFARALTNGARWHCSAVFGGAIYTPEEMNVAVDADGQVIDAPMPTPVNVPTSQAAGDLTRAIKELRALGLDYKSIQNQMEFHTGKRTRADLTADEVELVAMEFDSLVQAMTLEAAEATEMPVEVIAAEVKEATK